MLRATSFAILAILAACALAAPTPFKSLSKTFKVALKPRIGVFRTPLQEMTRTYAKYGWQIVVVDPSSPFNSIWGRDDSSSSSAPVPAATSSTATTNPEGGEAAATSAYIWTPTVSSSATVAVVTTTLIAFAATSAATTAVAATSTASGKTGEVTATPEENESKYLSPVNIGGQSLNLDFDTGSADLWVFSSSLPSSESSGHRVFDPSKSSTWQTYEGGSWQISYGDGSNASGTVGFDKVDIGGATVTKQAVELATSISGSFVEDTNSDGLVGLGFSKINTVEPQQQKTFFENIIPSLALPVFTADLEDNASGTYTFGEIDASQYSGDIHYVDIDNSSGFWQFSSGSYSVGGTSGQCQTCSPAIADTGTSLILVDDDIVTAYYKQVNGAQFDEEQAGYIYPCDADLPSFGVAVGDYTATIKGSAITFAQLGDGTCFGGIQTNQGQGLQIYGDVLFKNFFAVFDGGNNKFGLATKASAA